MIFHFEMWIFYRASSKTVTEVVNKVTQLETNYIVSEKFIL